MASVNCDAASVLLKEQEFRKMMPESKKMQQNFHLFTTDRYRPEKQNAKERAE